MIMLESPECERWFVQSPQLFGHEHLSIITFGAWAPLPSIQYVLNFLYMSYEPKYSSSHSPCVGQAFNMYTLPFLSKTSASRIILQSGQILCVYLIVFLSAVFLLERLEICINSISITYYVLSSKSCSFVYKHNLTTPTMISLLYLTEQEKRRWLFLYVCI